MHAGMRHNLSLAGVKGGEAQATPKEPLQVRIPLLVKRQFKAYAAMRGLEPNELFVEMWEHFQRTQIRSGTRS